MKIHNFLDLKLENVAIHDGKGLCRHATVYDAQEIDAPVEFINYTVIPPGAGFGMHRHERNNEFYIVLCGAGIYYQDGEQVPVKKGDIIMNAPFAEHGIENTADVDMELLVLEVVVTD